MRCVFCGDEITTDDKAEDIEACKECDENLENILKEILDKWILKGVINTLLKVIRPTE